MSSAELQQAEFPLPSPMSSVNSELRTVTKSPYFLPHFLYSGYLMNMKPTLYVNFYKVGLLKQLLCMLTTHMH